MFQPLAAIAASLLLLPGFALAQGRVELEPAKDNTLYQDPTGPRSNGAGTACFTGLDNRSRRKRALLAFDVAGAIPPGSTVTSVEVQLTVVFGAATSFQFFHGLHRMFVDWGEAGSVAPGPGVGSGPGQGAGAEPEIGDATWNHAFWPKRRWGRPGGIFNATAAATATVRGTPGQRVTFSSTPHLVGDVQAWLDDPSSNFGWMLRGDEFTTGTARAFYTREATVARVRPRLTILYTEPRAAAVVVGSGCTGSSGPPLTLMANGLPVVPNPAFALSLSGGPVGSVRVYVLFLEIVRNPLPLGGSCFLYGNIETVFGTLPGAGPLPLPVPDEVALLGGSFGVQGVGVETPAPGRLVSSNALALTFGR